MFEVYSLVHRPQLLQSTALQPSQLAAGHFLEFLDPVG